MMISTNQSEINCDLYLCLVVARFGCGLLRAVEISATGWSKTAAMVLIILNFSRTFKFSRVVPDIRPFYIWYPAGYLVKLMRTSNKQTFFQNLFNNDYK